MYLCEVKIIFIINPISGTRSKSDIPGQIQLFCKRHQLTYRICDSDITGRYSQVSSIIADDLFTHVCIIGGDGTVSQAIGALRHLPVIFAIIPCGSGNGLAYAAGIPSQVNKALNLLLHGSVETIDAMQLNDRFTCMLSGMGADAQVATEFSQEHKRGLITYTKLVWKQFWNPVYYDFTVKTEEGIIRTKAWFVSIANSNQFGNHITIAPKASLRDGLLDIIIVTPMAKPILVLKLLQQLVFGRPAKWQAAEKTKGVLYLQSRGCTVTAHKPVPLHLDGEPAGTTTVLNCSIIPGCFRLLCGRSVV